MTLLAGLLAIALAVVAIYALVWARWRVRDRRRRRNRLVERQAQRDDLERARSGSRTLPYWIGGGAEVSDLAYRIVVATFDTPPSRGLAHLVVELGVDEADVLRGLAELERAGVFER